MAGMRPFSFGELLDGAFTVYRRNFAALFGAALAPQLPIIALWLLLPVLVGGAAMEDTFTVATVLLFPYTGAAALVVWGGLTWAAVAAYGGESLTMGTILKRGLRKFLALFVATVVMAIAVGAAFVVVGIATALAQSIAITALLMLAALIVGLALFASFFATYAAIVVEDRGPFAAIQRSFDLSRGSRVRILGTLVVAWLIAFVPIFTAYIFMGMMIGIGAAVAGDPEAVGQGWMMGVFQAIAATVTAIATPFTAAVIGLLYIDRRARTEAPDLEAAAARLSTP